MGQRPTKEQKAIAELEATDQALLDTQDLNLLHRGRLEKSEKQAANNLRAACMAGTNPDLMTQHARTLVRIRKSIAESALHYEENEALHDQMQLDLNEHRSNAIRRELTKNMVTLAITPGNDPATHQRIGRLLEDARRAINRPRPVPPPPSAAAAGMLLDGGDGDAMRDEVAELVEREKAACARKILDSYQLTTR